MATGDIRRLIPVCTGDDLRLTVAVNVSAKVIVAQGGLPVNPVHSAELGDPGRFLGMMRAQGLTPAGIRLFADHQDYTAELIAELVSAARKSGASWLLTTLKDIVKFPPDFAAATVYTMRLGLRHAAGDDWLATLTETP